MFLLLEKIAKSQVSIHVAVAHQTSNPAPDTQSTAKETTETAKLRTAYSSQQNLSLNFSKFNQSVHSLQLNPSQSQSSTGSKYNSPSNPNISELKPRKIASASPSK